MEERYDEIINELVKKVKTLGFKLKPEQIYFDDSRRIHFKKNKAFGRRYRKKAQHLGFQSVSADNAFSQRISNTKLFRH